MLPLQQGMQNHSEVLTCDMREARPPMSDLLVSMRTPQDVLIVLRLCTITASRVLPPSSTCLQPHTQV